MFDKKNHSYYMKLAIAQAKKGIYLTRPNPAVGCVLVKDDRILAEGFTSPAGGNHAEINALKNAKAKGVEVAGCTAYVTLEPCSHYGRTPPCAKALIEHRIAHVVIAGLDPNPQVAGRGVAMLEQAGVKVTIGIMTDQAEQVNKGFLKAMKTGNPFVRVKIASSLDGRTAMADGESKWITGAEAREDVQTIRAMSGAIITGSQTVIDDNPLLTVRSEKLGTSVAQILQPKVVILDRRQRLSANCDYYVCKCEDTLFWQNDDLNTLLQTLVADYHIYDVLVEAGAGVAGAFIEKGLVDELIVYQAPCLLGVNTKAMANFSLNKLSKQKIFSLVSHETIGNDLKLIYSKI